MVTHQIQNALTFDVEDWYQVTAFDDVYERSDWPGLEDRLKGNLEKILAILDARNTRATFFMLGVNVLKTPEIVSMTAVKGHEIGSHGMDHRLIYNMTPDIFRQDLQDSIRVIRDAHDIAVTGYRAPSFSISTESLWALDVIKDAGIQYDSSIVRTNLGLYGIPDSNPLPGPVQTPAGRQLMEFPISTRSILGRSLPFCGGAFFRVFPYPLIHRWIREKNNLGQPVIIYLHPWELDPGHPTPKGKKWKDLHSVNLKHTEKKLDALLKAFPFTTAGEVLAGLSADS